ncbi:hypothetical protein BDV30DRAFT_208521 [Aspergillus minisclerotigenes]|uniref:Fe2OG dioxygenase domain-containing protein n=1 Tax=Aspergillus minisclerotigenes TaxID=656917 RepID=A0A5N6JAY4_9EURO|nr:hypothetical protein BDV30DRAFT_208521 [Aspergillus minisclerotigenes]
MAPPATTTTTTVTEAPAFNSQDFQRYKKYGKFGVRETQPVGSIVGDFDSIPVIDVSGIYSDELSDREAVAEKIRDACMRVGFFYVEGHGIPQDIVDGVFDIGKRFFALDFDDKMECFINNTPHYRGYTPLYGAGKANAEGLGNANEAFDWGHDSKLNDDPNETFIDPHMRGENVWPTKLPELEERLSDYYRRLRAFCRTLTRNLALSLGLKEDWFDPLLTHPGCSAVVAHYPPQPKDKIHFGIDPHTDSEFCTVLATDEVRALEVLNKDGIWVSAPPRKGCFIVNIGDQLQSYTNGLYVSTFHRVLNYSGEERYSIPFFMSTNFETVIRPIEKFVPPGSQVEYDDITAGEMYKNAMIKFHQIAKKHPVFSKYLKEGVHDEEYENQAHFHS